MAKELLKSKGGWVNRWLQQTGNGWECETKNGETACVLRTGDFTTGIIFIAWVAHAGAQQTTKKFKGRGAFAKAKSAAVALAEGQP